jgi:hypothetical protein
MKNTIFNASRLQFPSSFLCLGSNILSAPPPPKPNISSLLSQLPTLLLIPPACQEAYSGRPGFHSMWRQHFFLRHLYKTGSLKVMLPRFGLEFVGWGETVPLVRGPLVPRLLHECRAFRGMRIGKRNRSALRRVTLCHMTYPGIEAGDSLSASLPVFPPRMNASRM